MLNWTLAFFVLAIIAAVFGFGGLATAFAGVAKILFFIFILAVVISFISSLTR